MCCDTNKTKKSEKTEKEFLLLCKTGMDSLLQSSQVTYEYRGYVGGIGYVDGHCLDSGKSLSLYQDKYIQVLEYGNFKKGYYMVDSVVLPLFGFEVFKDRQEIVAENLNWHPKDSILEYLLHLGPDRSSSLISIYPYKDKIFGLRNSRLLVMDVQKKSIEILISYSLYERVPYKKSKSIFTLRSTSTPLELVRMKSDTLILSRKLPYYEFCDECGDSTNVFPDTILVTLDGETFVSKLRDYVELTFYFDNGKVRKEYSCNGKKGCKLHTR